MSIEHGADHRQAPPRDPRRGCDARRGRRQRASRHEAVQEPPLGLALVAQLARRGRDAARRSSGLSSRSAGSGAARMAATRSAVVASSSSRGHGDRGQPGGHRLRRHRRTGRWHRSPAPCSSRRGRRAARCPPRSGTRPSEVSRIANCTSSATTRRSAARASWKPGADRVSLHRRDDDGVDLGPGGEAALERRDRRRPPPRRPRRRDREQVGTSPATPPGVSIARSRPAENDGPSALSTTTRTSRVERRRPPRPGPATGWASGRCAGPGCRGSRVRTAPSRVTRRCGWGGLVSLTAGRLSARSRTSRATASASAPGHPGPSGPRRGSQCCAMRSRRMPSATMKDTATVRSTSSGSRAQHLLQRRPAVECGHAPRPPALGAGASAMVRATVATASLSLEPGGIQDHGGGRVGFDAVRLRAAPRPRRAGAGAGRGARRADDGDRRSAIICATAVGDVDPGVVGGGEQHRHHDRVRPEARRGVRGAGRVVVEVCRVHGPVGRQLAHVRRPASRRPAAWRGSGDPWASRTMSGVGAHPPGRYCPAGRRAGRAPDTTSPTTTTAGALHAGRLRRRPRRARASSWWFAARGSTRSR